MCGRVFKTGRAKARPLHSPYSVVLYKFPFVAGERIVERLDKGVIVNEIAFPFRPGRENFLLLHLLQCFVLIQGLLNDRGSFLQHFGKGTDVVEIRERAVARDNLHIRRQLRSSFFHRVDHALDAAPRWTRQ